ncbi:hypothetical protein HET69_35955 [Streptomyces sp. CJ_13]|uniref:hypothetical protein n=1 Tax=Streptomyces sp. CJ_13 TaxID=2724943 RepID=UPI00017E7FE9|nr:hypothetical protein [Streptomyces sp. CJ_13]EDX22858.1 hypothetical protein SSAG_02649 [Streptomyces sp. Mg1]MBT1189239.1 hypothetical protein [Streptomyces sp. CJ_13]
MKDPQEENSRLSRRRRLRRSMARLRWSARGAVPIVALLAYGVQLVRALHG